MARIPPSERLAERVEQLRRETDVEDLANELVRLGAKKAHPGTAGGRGAGGVGPRAVRAPRRGRPGLPQRLQAAPTGHRRGAADGGRAPGAGDRRGVPLGTLAGPQATDRGAGAAGGRAVRPRLVHAGHRGRPGGADGGAGLAAESLQRQPPDRGALGAVRKRLPSGTWRASRWSTSSPRPSTSPCASRPG